MGDLGKAYAVDGTGWEAGVAVFLLDSFSSLTQDSVVEVGLTICGRS